MRSLVAFIKKEIMAQIRSGKLVFVFMVFVILGIMNPAVAKMTPWLLDVLSDSMSESGITVSVVTVSAMDSWVQFFKNMPIGLITFILLQSSIFTKEYSSATLVLSLTKGLERFKVVIAKSTVLCALWSIGFWMCFGITYGYNAYFWDNSIAQNLAVSVLNWWVFGIFVISLVTLFSTLSSSNTGVLVGVGGVVLVSYLIGMLPKINKYLPTFLANGNSLIYGVSTVEDYIAAIVITVTASIVCFAISIPIFNKKQL